MSNGICKRFSGYPEGDPSCLCDFCDMVRGVKYRTAIERLKYLQGDDSDSDSGSLDVVKRQKHFMSTDLGTTRSGTGGGRRVIRSHKGLGD